MRLGDSLYHILPQVDDELCKTLEKLQRLRIDTTVLAPPWSLLVARSCFHQAKRRGIMTLIGVSDFVALRVSNTAMDLKVPRTEAMMRLLWWHNKIARLHPFAAMRIRVR